jgi:hypothetical protein
LYPRSPPGWHADREIADFSQIAASLTAESDYTHLPFASRSGSGHYIGRPTACAERQQKVARLADGLNLPRKDMLHTVIVANCRQYGRIRAQANGGPASALSLKAANEFRGYVLRVRRAATVTDKQELLPGPDRLDYQFSGATYFGNEAVKNAPLNLDTL